MLGAVLAVVLEGSTPGPVAEAAVKGAELCVKAQEGSLDLLGDDRMQKRTMVLPSETGPGGVFLTLGPEGCDVLIGSDGEAAVAAVTAWVESDPGGAGWKHVPSLGVTGQGEGGDGARYYAAVEAGLALAMGRPPNDMGRVVVFPRLSSALLRLRVETAAHAAARPAGEAVVDAVDQVCPLMLKAGERMSEEETWRLRAQLRTFSGDVAELAHADETRETVVVNADETGCRVALRARANSRIAHWEEDVPGRLESQGWQPQGVNEWRAGERSVWINSAPGLMMVEVVSH